MNEFWTNIIFTYSVISTIILIWLSIKTKVDTISHLWYTLERSYLFILFIINIAFPLSIVVNDLLFFLGGCLLFGVVIAPGFRNEESTPDQIDKEEESIHIIGAVGSIVISLIYTIIKLGLLWPTVLVLFGCGLIGISKINSKGKWCEILALIVIYLVILIYIIWQK